MESVHQDNCTLEDIWTLKASTDHESMLHLMTTPQQCLVAFKCVNNISDKATPQQCLGAFKRVCNGSGLLSNEWMEVCEKEGNHSPTLSPSNELQNEKAIDTNGNKMARFSATNDVQAKDCRHTADIRHGGGIWTADIHHGGGTCQPREIALCF